VKKPRPETLVNLVAEENSASHLEASILLLNKSISLLEAENQSQEAIYHIQKVVELIKTIPKTIHASGVVTQCCDNETQTESPMHINAIPVDCLMLILKFFPLQKIITFREVCLHWKNVVE